MKHIKKFSSVTENLQEADERREREHQGEIKQKQKEIRNIIDNNSGVDANANALKAFMMLREVMYRMDMIVVDYDQEPLRNDTTWDKKLIEKDPKIKEYYNKICERLFGLQADVEYLYRQVFKDAGEISGYKPGIDYNSPDFQ